jgi:flagellar biosynthesis/type III secretory pathway M-ring protein FliF/YscJ
VEKKDFIVALLPKAILALVLIMLMLMIRGFLKYHLKVAKGVLEMQPAMLAAGGSAGQLMPGMSGLGGYQNLPGRGLINQTPTLKPPEEEISEEARQAAARKQQIMEFARSQPDVASTLLKSWLLEK